MSRPRATYLSFDWQRFGQAVRLARLTAYLDLGALEHRTGVGASSLCRIENGKTCTPEAMLTLCAWLQIDPRSFTSIRQQGGAR